MKPNQLIPLNFPMTPIERATGRYMRAPDHGDDAGPVTSNDFDLADIVLSGSGAEEEKSGGGEDTVDRGGEDKNAKEVEEGADEADATKPDKGEEGEEGEEGGDRQPSADDDKGAQRKPRYERRIDSLTARNKELEGRLAALEAGKGGKEPEHRGEADKTDKNARPVLEDYETYEDFVDALTDWKVDNKLSERDTNNKAATAKNEFVKRLQEGSKRFADWDDVVTEDTQISPHMVEAIHETDDPAAVVHYIGSNPEEADRIRSLSPARQAVEIGKIEAKLAKPSAAKEESKGPKKATEAPEPPKTPKGSGSVEKSIEDMDTDDYIRAMNKKQGIKLRHYD